MNTEFKFVQKSQLKSIDISQFSTDLPDLKNIYEAKSIVIGKWLMAKLEQGLDNGLINVNDIMPSKSEFAYLLGVSTGTMQNAFRYIEDLGYVESKQCIGTLVRDYNQPVQTLRKLTSKRDLAVEAIKRYIKNDSFSVGELLPSSRTIATITGFSANTTRLALEYLTTCKIVEHKFKNANEFGWILKSLDFSLKNGRGIENKSQTLVDMIVRDLEKYITQNLKVGDKLPPHQQLAQALKASIKTVHDSLQILVNKGIILPRRGRYGSTVIKIPNSPNTSVKPEMSIFAPAKDAAFYHYEKFQNKIMHMIANEYNVGDKLPSITELSYTFNISPNTIRKAFHNLSKEGYLVFSRGRYGGTFVIDIPQIDSSQTFKWLAVNPQYAKELSEKN